jgi:hypothetical protein
MLTCFNLGYSTVKLIYQDYDSISLKICIKLVSHIFYYILAKKLIFGEKNRLKAK